jgi:recombination protein RecR
MKYLDALIQSLKILPGIGPRSAQRIAYFLLQHQRSGAALLAEHLKNALLNIVHCKRCNNFSEHELCELCSDTSRRLDQLCVVEMPSDLIALEQSGSYEGYYFVLMGQLSPMKGVTASDLPFENLLMRCLDSSLREVIIATNFTAEGDLTSHAIELLVKECGLDVSRMARGMPAGGEIELTDLATISQAIQSRHKIISSSKQIT